MTPLAALVLAWMVSIHAPGLSPYSLVPSGLEKGAAGCRWDGYNKACVRVETEEEGIERYKVIASSIAEAAERDAPGWSQTMARLLTTVAAHESGFRRDIHSGIGPAGIARGDCARSARGAIPGSCRSWCLIQVNRGPFERTPEGFLRHELVGVTPELTERCVGTASKALARFRGSAPSSALSLFLAYGGLRRLAPDTPTGRRILDRVSTYERLGSVPAPKDQ